MFDWQGLYYIEKVLSRMKDPVAFDIGANLGNHTVVMARICKRVCSFEPQLRTGIRLNDNLSFNNINNVSTFDFGLSNENTIKSIYVSKSGNGGATTFVSSLARPGAAKVEAMNLRVGDEVSAENGIDGLDLIKIDVEGYEAQALLGLKATISRFRPIIFMEWNNDATRSSFSKEHLFDCLFPGWQISSIQGSSSRNRYKATFSGKVSRLLNKVFRPKTALLDDFDHSRKYGNIIICPPEKMSLLA